MRIVHTVISSCSSPGICNISHDREVHNIYYEGRIHYIQLNITVTVMNTHVSYIYRSHITITVYESSSSLIG